MLRENFFFQEWPTDE